MNPNAPMRHRWPHRAVSVILCLLLPLLAGGCPDFRNDVVSVVEEATRSLIFASQSPEQVIEIAGTGLLDSVIDLVFDQFRGRGSAR